MNSGGVKPSFGLWSGPGCRDDGSCTGEIRVHTAPRIKIKVISTSTRLEIGGDVFVLEFMLSILES